MPALWDVASLTDDEDDAVSPDGGENRHGDVGVAVLAVLADGGEVERDGERPAEGRGGEIDGAVGRDIARRRRIDEEMRARGEGDGDAVDGVGGAHFEEALPDGKRGRLAGGNDRLAAEGERSGAGLGEGAFPGDVVGDGERGVFRRRRAPSP